MTLSEAQTLRTAVLAQYQAVIAGGVTSYTTGTGRSAEKISAADLFKQLNQLDLLISRLSGAGVGVAQFRNFE